MTGAATLRVLLMMALRNLRTHRTKTLIVGSIMFFGTMLWTLGSSLVGSIEDAMARTIVDSLSGHLQIYARDSRDQLELFGGGTFGQPDIGEIPAVEDLARAVAAVPNVAALVPMGTTVGLMTHESELDRGLGELRAAVYAGEASAIAAGVARVRYLIGQVEQEYLARGTSGVETRDLRRGKAALAYALADTFWTDFGADALGRLEFLDTRVAPLGSEGTLVYMRLLGVDLDRYMRVFDQIEIVEGRAVPAGRRGVLFSRWFMDNVAKDRLFRELDALHKLVVGDGRRLAGDVEMADRVERAGRLYRRLVTGMDPAAVPGVVAALQAELGSTETSLDVLIRRALELNDDNFLRRYAFFYAAVAPHVRLYPFAVGDTLAVRAFTNSGYMRSANLKLYGIYRFRGMEDSDLSGVYNLMDMMTFRELFGAATPQSRAELGAIRDEVAVADVGRADAEAALFGGSALVVEGRSGGAGLDAIAARDRLAAADATAADGFDPDEQGRGLALHAAVMLEDPGRIEETRQALQQAIDAAGLPLRVVDWQTAAGFVGQLTIAMRAVLVFGIFVIFLVALVIINNTVVISTLERIGEIGTLRAIGAQRSFVLLMFLVEIAVIAALAGAAGALAGALAVSLIAIRGIPAFAENMNFLFGGPRLYPTVGLLDMIVGLVIIVGVSLVATYFPARAATRVQPVEAMQARE